MNHHVCGPIAEAIARAKHQEGIEEARIERIVQGIPKDAPSIVHQAVQSIQQIVRPIARVAIAMMAKIQEKQGPIL
jgi:hypothetical protein